MRLFPTPVGSTTYAALSVSLVVSELESWLGARLDACFGRLWLSLLCEDPRDRRLDVRERNRRVEAELGCEEGAVRAQSRARVPRDDDLGPCGAQRAVRLASAERAPQKRSYVRPREGAGPELALHDGRRRVRDVDANVGVR